mgnify:CR=1 FL=1
MFAEYPADQSGHGAEQGQNQVDDDGGECYETDHRNKFRCRPVIMDDSPEIDQFSHKEAYNDYYDFAADDSSGYDYVFHCQNFR